MATLYVENVPDDLYLALRSQARHNRKSIAAEVIELLGKSVVTLSELRAREAFLRKVKALRREPSAITGEFPSAEEMQREDRLR